MQRTPYTMLTGGGRRTCLPAPMMHSCVVGGSALNAASRTGTAANHIVTHVARDTARKRTDPASKRGSSRSFNKFQWKSYRNLLIKVFFLFFPDERKKHVESSCPLRHCGLSCCRRTTCSYAVPKHICWRYWQCLRCFDSPFQVLCRRKLEEREKHGKKESQC